MRPVECKESLPNLHGEAGKLPLVTWNLKMMMWEEGGWWEESRPFQGEQQQKLTGVKAMKRQSTLDTGYFLECKIHGGPRK